MRKGQAPLQSQATTAESLSKVLSHRPDMAYALSHRDIEELIPITPGDMIQLKARGGAGDRIHQNAHRGNSLAIPGYPEVADFANNVFYSPYNPIRSQKMAHLDRKQLFSMLPIGEIERIALRFAPKEYDRIVALDSAPERVELLIEIALVGNWLDELVDTARFRSCINSYVGAQLASADPGHRLLNCSSSNCPVFTNTDPYDVLGLTIQTDFDTVNNGDTGNDQSPGTISYDDPVTGETVAVDCIVEARGNSRRQCGWRPLRFRFDGDPKGTIFTGTGRFIDFVTHCGYRQDQWIGLAGMDEVEHDRRLHQEYTFYQIIRAIGGMTLETRLVSTTYKNLAGKTLEHRYGFIRERKSRAPRRCGLKRREKKEGDSFRPPNATSLFQAEFHHKLIFNDDYDFPQAERNVVRMTDGSEDFYFPYDFDLSGVIEPKHYGRTVLQNAGELLKWLRQQQPSLARTQVAEVLSKESELRQIIAGTRADAIGKTELDEWLQTHLDRLKEIFCGWSIAEKVPDQSSRESPALASSGGLLHLVYSDESSTGIWHSSWDGSSWSPKVKLPNQQSRRHPALANHCGSLHMVHVGVSSNSIWHSIWDGGAWSHSEMIPAQSSKAPCALASSGGLLHLVYSDESSTGIWHSSWDGSSWSPKAKLPNQQSKRHPALANHCGILHMVHADASSNSIWHSIWDGETWLYNEIIPEQSSKACSALASAGGLLHLVYSDESSNEFWHSSWDGSSWSPKAKIPNQQSKRHPAIANHDGNLHMAHAGDSSSNISTSIWAACELLKTQHPPVKAGGC